MHPDPLRHQGGVRVYWLLASLAFGGAILEAVISFTTGILALRADAIHAFGDALAIGLAIWFEARHDQRTPEENHRLQTRIRLVIGLLIATAGVHSGLESIDHWSHPVGNIGLVMFGTAGLCALINRAMVFVLGSCPCHIDGHLRAHIKSDFLVSVGVAVGGLLVAIAKFAGDLFHTGDFWWWIEPLIASFISLRILILGLAVIVDKHHD